MQTHTHLSGQVPGQVAGQMPSIPQQNMSSLPSQGLQSWRRTWQTEGDVGIRKLVVEKIMLLFQKRKSHVSQEWQQKLPDLVKRLEESLYRDAASRDEYADLSTLEQRLQAVARRMGSARNMPNYAHQGINMASSSTIGTMIPTPGVPLVTNSSTMVPTPGGDITTMPTSVTGSVVSNSGSMPNLVPSSMLFKGCAAPVGNPGSMIPTPGLNSKYFSVPLEPASVPGNSLVGQQGLGPLTSPSNTQLMGSMDYSSMGSQMIPTPAIQQQLNDGPSGHIYRSMNAQFGGTVANSRQQKISPFRLANNVGFNNGMQLTGNRQLVNGNMKFSSSSGYGNSSHGSNVQMQHQHHFVQHHEQHSAMPVSSGGVTSMKNMSMNTMALQTSKMIPVPGLPQQSSFQAHQLQSQREPSEQVSLPHNSSGLSSSQHEQVQYLKSKGPFQAQLRSNVFGHKQPSIGSQHEDNRTGSDLMTFTIPDRSLLEQQQSLSMQSQHQHQQQLSQLSLLQHQSPLQMLPLHHEKEEEHQVQETQQTQSHLEQVWQQLPGKDQELENSFNQQLQHQKILKHEVDQDLCMETEPYQQNSVQQQISLRKIQEGQSYGESQQQPGDQENSNEKEKSNEMTANSAVVIGQTARKPLNAPNVTSMPGENVEGQRSQQYLKQQRWLLFLRHASRCTAPEGQCHTTPYCHNARQLWSHITKCTDRNCQYARCYASRTLLRHHQQCRDPKCPVCGPVRQILLQQRTQAQTGRGQLATSMPIPEVSTACKPINAPDLACTESSLNKSSTMLSSSTQGQQPPTKRAKMEPLTETVPQNVTVYTAKNQSIPDISPSQGQTVPPSGIKQEVSSAVIKEEANHIGSPLMKSELHSVPQSSSMSQRSLQVKTELSQNEAYLGFQQVHSTVNVKIEGSAAGVTKIAKQETISNASPANASDLSTAKSSKPKIKGVSLIELFTPEQIREHISGLRQWVGQSKSKAEKNQAMEHHMNENSCQLCAVERLTFEPPPIYCTSCGARIKRNASYWTVGSGETRQYFCIPCYNDIRSDTVELDGITYLKSKFEKKKNDEETEEAWVQCDKCEAWQHQVCALFNGRRNEGGQAEYTCPQCCIKEIERGERKPLPQSAVLGAKDLPKTLLSDHIEHRLARRMKQERLERARSQGKSFDEVPGAESLIVRVVSSVDKKLEVKQRFLEIFQEEDYPTEFAYKSKVLLLFQKIEGVEVCLYGMYIQEFGSECSQPNQRRVYLSYLDSVKYFRPEVKTVSGEALRTFVYHEILIAYLDYCKRRGFTSCYIWACPPLKGEDYILYCHPEIQKTPKADKLREWYLTMLRKAVNENIVAEVTNLHDHFFVSTGECKAKVTAARLPYFDGDYWPGAAEDMIMQLQQDEEDSSKSQKKSKIKKPPTKRASKVAAQAELTNNASKDLQLMHKLGESIYPMKEDFIMVHMQYACAICCNFILSGYRWACKQCKDFHICDQCYDTEQKLEERNRHPINSKEAHQFFPVEVSDVSADTKDKDEIMESEFFDTRQAFLSLCQGNHYQYDTLRRAKHSSMMVLYHLHNPTAPAFVTTCNFCHHDIETGQGWRCETCPDFDLCNVCYQKGDAVKHPHKLIPHPSLAERDAQSKEARQQRVLQLRKMLELLIHASQCFSSQCSYPNCRRVKGLFRHGINCKVRASGGCPLCKRMWYLLQLHARACKESECRVPRCKDLKEHLRRLQQQMESRRRAAVKEMMRQRAAEAAGISS